MRGYYNIATGNDQSVASAGRRKLFYIDPMKLLRHFTDSKVEGSYLALTKLHLPVDARVLGMYHDYLSGMVVFVVESELYDPVPEGFEAPREQARMEVYHLKLDEDSACASDKGALTVAPEETSNQ